MPQCPSCTSSLFFDQPHRINLMAALCQSTQYTYKSQTFKNLTNNQKQAALNLNQVVEVIKEERDTYHKNNLTATETFLNKLPFSNNDSFFTMWQYISIFVITGVIISHFILVFRVRKLFALIVSSWLNSGDYTAELLTPPPTPIYSTPPVDVDPFYSYYYLIAVLLPDCQSLPSFASSIL